MRDLSNSLAVVFGGSGFLGRYIVQRLARSGARVRVAVRRPEKAMFLKPMGATGQIQIVQANVRRADSVASAMAGADIAVNLVGILAPGGKQTFEGVQRDGAANIAKAAAAEGAARMLHVSALGADAESPSRYARTKADAEALVQEAFAKATILRPSLIFGPEDSFFNRFAAMARMLPVMPVIAGDTRFQPVYVGDVADAGLAALTLGRKTEGKIYALGGPQIYTFRELMELVLAESMRRRRLVEVPMPIARVQAFFAQYLPNPPLTPDQLELLTRDNVVGAEGNGLTALGIDPTPVEAILPTYLKRYRPKGQFSRRDAAA